jgi:hypothetical protein
VTVTAVAKENVAVIPEVAQRAVIPEVAQRAVTAEAKQAVQVRAEATCGYAAHVCAARVCAARVCVGCGCVV